MKTVQSMSPEDKQEKVFRVFEKIAKGYDSANVRISLGMQDSWKKMLIRELTRQVCVPVPGILQSAQPRPEQTIR